MKFNKLFSSLILSILFISPNVLAQTKHAKVMFVGDFKGGKTAIFRKMFGDEYTDYDKQPCDKFEPKLLPNIRVQDNDLIVKIWDTPGFADYREKVIDFIEDADFMYIVIDVCPKLENNVKNIQTICGCK